MLNNLNVLVTGGSLGIGKAIAAELASQGARVTIAARQAEALEECCAELKTLAAAIQLDVADPQSVAALAQRLGPLDALVNCAGIYGPIGRLGDLSLEAFEQAIQVNLLGTVRVCQALLGRLLGARRGKIVNLCGGGAASAFPHYSAYACSKIAVARFSENLAAEYPELDVNCMAPGFVLTRLHEQTLAAGAERAGAAFYENTRRQLESGGVPATRAAQLTAFLLSPSSDGITGKFIAAPWDPWETEAFQARLRNEPHFATMRRIDGKNFSSVDQTP